MSCVTRRAVLTDAPAACDLVRRSIIELCHADHGGDHATLTQWLANKTRDEFERWIGSQRHVAIVAERDGVVVGFGLLNLDGRISLLYISPDARFSGVSKSLLATLEQEALAAGLQRLELESTTTSLRFYTDSGYTPSACSKRGFGVTTCQPLSRELTPERL
jgi:GNAT superfamily N-acetyltransferase